MANSETVDLMGIGQHCSINTCKRLDFLPFKCSKCSEIFCVDHRSERDHNCPNADLGDNHMPICPLCHQMVSRTRGQSDNDQVEKHIQSGCKELIVTQQKKRSNRCNHKPCRHRELIPFVCPQCEKVFCIRHRHALDHGCEGAAMTTPRTVAVH